MKGIGDEGGQVIVLVAVAMVVLLGLGGLAIDTGSWFHARRQLQSVVDAAALAGAQDLPAATSNSTAGPAQTTAQTFATQNVTSNPDSLSGAVSPLTFPAPVGASCTTNNCIAVDASRPTSGIFAEVLSAFFKSVTVHAHAQAYVGPPGAVKNLLAAAIDQNQFNSDTGCPASCKFPSNQTTLNFDTSSGFTLLDLNSASSSPTSGSAVSTNTMCQWVQTGFQNALPVNMWYGETSGQHNGLKNCFSADDKTVNLIPVFS